MMKGNKLKTKAMNNKEIRVINPDVEIRKSEDGKERIEGYGIVFNEWSRNLGGFIERIMPKAVSDLNWNDTVGVKNHSINHILGRVPRTMEITVDERGVKYSIEPPNTTNGKDTMEEIRSGLLVGSSFVFNIAEGGDNWEKPEERNGVWKRTVNKFSTVSEMGPVVGEAYSQTDVTLAKRNLGLIKDGEEKEVNQAIEEQRQTELLIKIQQEQTSKQLESYKINLGTNNKEE